jgi:epoxyqueuosine reductase QueG
VCPWNVRFATELKEPAFTPREVLAGKDAPTLARDLLAMEQAEFSAAFRESPMKRARGSRPAGKCADDTGVRRRSVNLYGAVVAAVRRRYSSLDTRGC